MLTSALLCFWCFVHLTFDHANARAVRLPTRNALNRAKASFRNVKKKIVKQLGKRSLEISIVVSNEV